MKDHSLVDFQPFANESDVLTIGNLSIENRLDRLTLQGDVELTKDRKGLALARQLRALLDATVTAIEGEKELPQAVATEPTQEVRNPFS